MSKVTYSMQRTPVEPYLKQYYLVEQVTSTRQFELPGHLKNGFRFVLSWRRVIQFVHPRTHMRLSAKSSAILK